MDDELLRGSRIHGCFLCSVHLFLFVHSGFEPVLTVFVLPTFQVMDEPVEPREYISHRFFFCNHTQICIACTFKVYTAMAIYSEKTFSISLDSNAVLKHRKAGALTTIPQVTIALAHINFSNNHIDFKNTHTRTHFN